MGVLHYRIANADDLLLLVEMLADDTLGQQREDFRTPLPTPYLDAFEAILKDPNNELIVATHNAKIVGMLQLTYIPYLTYQGGWRGLIEGVRIAAEHRGKGYGNDLFRWAIARAKERGCHMLQLTSDKKRPDAIRFYESLGFIASHEGFKLHFV